MVCVILRIWSSQERSLWSPACSLQSHSRVSARLYNGSKKTGPKENWSSVKNALWKLVLLQMYLENSSENFLTDFFGKTMIWQNIHFIATVDSKPMSLSWMRWQSQADIADDHPISLTIFILLINSRIGHEDQQSPHDRVNLKYTVIFLAKLVYTDLLLANIASTPHNPTLSRYLTWLGDFN